MKFGEKLRLLRTLKKSTMSEVAKAVGVSLRAYSDYELGRRYPRTRDKYVKLADFFDVDVNYLDAEASRL